MSLFCCCGQAKAIFSHQDIKSQSCDDCDKVSLLHAGRGEEEVSAAQMPWVMMLSETEMGRIYITKGLQSSREHVNYSATQSWNSCWLSFFGVPLN